MGGAVGAGRSRHHGWRRQALCSGPGATVEALLANAGRGLGNGFLDQDFDDVRHIVDTNVTGTIYLLQKVGSDMRAQGHGRILITGSIAGFMPAPIRPFATAPRPSLNHSRLRCGTN